MGEILNKVFTPADIPNLFLHTIAGNSYLEYIRDTGVYGRVDGDFFLLTNKIYTQVPIEVETVTTTDDGLTRTVGVVACYQSTSNFYWAYLHPNAGNVKLYAGTNLITSYTFPVQRWYVPRKLKLAANPTPDGKQMNLKVYVDDVLVINSTINNPVLTSGKCGLRFGFSDEKGKYLKVSSNDVVIDEWNFAAREKRIIRSGLFDVAFDMTHNMIHNATSTTSANFFYQIPLNIQENIDISFQFLFTGTGQIAYGGFGDLGRNYYRFRTSTTSVALDKYIGGTPTTLGSKAISPALSLNTKYTLRFRKVGNSLEVFLGDALGQNYTRMISATDSVIFHGFPMFWLHTLVRMQNFYAETIDTIPPAVPTNFVARHTMQGNLIIWTNPTAIDLAKIELQYSNNNIDWMPLKIFDKLMGDELQESYKDTAVLNRYYRIRAIDNGENASTWATAQAISGASGTVAYVG